MKNFQCTGIFGVAALGFLLGWEVQGKTESASRADLERPAVTDTPSGKDDLEVLARGPIHEAFAEPILRRQAAGQLITNQPPARYTVAPDFFLAGLFLRLASNHYYFGD